MIPFPCRPQGIGIDVLEEPKAFRGATAGSTERTMERGPVVPKDSRSPRLQVPQDLLTTRQSAFGIRAAKGPRRHDLGVMLHSGELPMATGVIPAEMAPVSFRTERRRPGDVSEGGRVRIGARAPSAHTLAKFPPLMMGNHCCR